MEFEVEPFQNFVQGNHLVIGTPGIGKTRLLLSLLEDEHFCDENTIQIVLTDSQERLSQARSPVPLTHIDPYATDMGWIAEPSTPGIHFASCNYVPRTTTFVECLANFARQREGNITHPVRTFLDFSEHYWKDAAFVEQFSRLHYVSESIATGDVRPLSIWTVLTSLSELPLTAQGMLPHAHLILINPLTPNVLQEVDDFLGQNLAGNLPSPAASGKDAGGFFYLPCASQTVYYRDRKSVV